MITNSFRHRFPAPVRLGLIKSGPLTNREIEKLDAFLLSDGGLENAMDVSTLDGLLCAVPIDDRNWSPSSSHAVRLLQVAKASRGRNPGTATSAQRPAAAHTTSNVFALGRSRAAHLVLSSLPSSSPIVVRWHRMGFAAYGDGSPVRNMPRLIMKCELTFRLKDPPCTRSIEFGDVVAHPILGGLPH
jgi:hypothetical protein